MRSTPQPENIDWACLLACLASSPGGRPPDSADSDRPPDSGDSDESDASEDQDSTADIREAVERAVLAMFVDSHNTGYYINSYTTKVNPGMDNVMKKLLNGVQRLRDEWDAADQTATPSRGVRPLQDQSDAADDTATPSRGEADDTVACPPSEAAGNLEKTKRQTIYKRILQMLSRFESAVRRASWKSGAEMVFPMLFGHMSFSTHRCWTVYLRRAQFLAQESWRLNYGQLAIQQNDDNAAQQITYTLKSGDDLKLKGWSEFMREGRLFFKAPDGQEFDEFDFAKETVRIARGVFVRRQ